MKHSFSAYTEDKDWACALISHAIEKTFPNKRRKLQMACLPAAQGIIRPGAVESWALQTYQNLTAVCFEKDMQTRGELWEARAKLPQEAQARILIPGVHYGQHSVRQFFDREAGSWWASDKWGGGSVVDADLANYVRNKNYLTWDIFYADAMEGPTEKWCEVIEKLLRAGRLNCPGVLAINLNGSSKRGESSHQMPIAEFKDWLHDQVREAGYYLRGRLGSPNLYQYEGGERTTMYSHWVEVGGRTARWETLPAEDEE